MSLDSPEPFAKASLTSPKHLAEASHVAIVILNYNGASLLNQFLPITIKHSGEVRIIVADNASTDGSVELLQRHFPSIEVIQLDQNYGYCGGYNRALRQVAADYYVLLNSDIEVTANWLTPMIDLLDRDEDIGALQPKILSHADKHKFEHAGAAGGFIDSFGYPFCRGRIFDHVENDRGQYDDQREVFWASGACLVIRSKAFHQFHGFDEDYFAHMEEIDLCWKLQRAGQKIYYSGQSTIYHIGAGTLAYGNPRKVFLNFRNGLFLIFKHLPISDLIYKIPVRLGLDIIACIRFLLRNEWTNSGAILQAHVDFWKNVTREVRKRRALQKSYPAYPRKNIKSGSIVFDYYVLGKKVFSQ